MEAKTIAGIFFLALSLSFHVVWCTIHSVGSCNFEGRDWLCGYEQPTESDNFNWSYVSDRNGDHVMQIDTAQHQVGNRAQLITPEIQEKSTHCFSYKVYVDCGVNNASIPSNDTSTNAAPGLLNVFVLHKDSSVLRLPVWSSTNIVKNIWNTIQLALNPRAYRIVFEAVVSRRIPGLIAINDVLVSSSPCDSAPHFLRLGDKEVNIGQNETLQCLLWGHSGIDTYVILQKSTGETTLPISKQEYDDHLSTMFSFTDTVISDNGMYRCVSGNETKVGVSNYGHLYVRVPPRPKRGPKLVEPGPNSFIIQLNANDFTGDGPIIQTILSYRPVNETWSDVHHITTQDYHLWTLQPDTEYDLAVTLVRPGNGGAGPPGPSLRRKTTCGIPKKSVQNIAFDVLSSHEIKLTWDIPDLSITQCHNYRFIIHYRLYNEEEEEDDNIRFEKLKIQKDNTIIIPGLKPFSEYMFRVQLTNPSGSAETEWHKSRTLAGVPGIVPPGSFAPTSFNETTISLKWEPPKEPNGVITGYEVSYTGESSNDLNLVPENSDGFIQINSNERTLVLKSLNPGTIYQISIRAKTTAGYGSAIDIRAKTDIAPPTIPQYPPLVKRDNDTETPTTIEIIILPAASNGAPITNYHVIVEDVTGNSKPQLAAVSTAKDKKDSRRGKRKRKKGTSIYRSRKRRQASDASTDDDACYKQPISYEDAMSSNQTAYASAEFAPEEINNEMTFVVGDNTVHSGFENKPLDPNRDYNIYVRVESTFNGVTKVSCVLVAQKARTSLYPMDPSSPTNGNTQTDGDTESGGSDTSDQQGGDNLTTSAGIPGESDKSEQKKVMMYAAIGGAAVGILVVLVAIILIVIKHRRRNKAVRKDRVVNPFEVRMMMTDRNSPAHTLLAVMPSGDGNTDRQALMPDLVGYEHQDFLEKASEDGGTAYGAPSTDERFAIRIEDFHVHVSQMKATDGYGFREEFASFPDGAAAAWTVADSPQNKNKNRYGNIMAYDHSRVILDPPSGHEDGFESDYINATYINGYKCPSMYIAAQAPTADTINDFWWMIWQEKTNIIVMVTNLVELGRSKCHKYWPDDRDMYGTVQVSFTNEEYVADYVVRSFLLQQAGGYDVREVKQFHFTSWPDHGVPSRPTNLLDFIRRIKTFEPQGQGPTLVHCSAGSGRTGCFIVIDMMLDMGRDEEIVDIYNAVRDLRSRRVNMVQTEEQYVFIHEAVLEAIVCGETSVAANMLVQHYDDIITVNPHTHFAPIEEEFETLNVITPKLTDEECSVARLPRNRASNRFMDVLPADRHLAYLVTPDPADRDNNYINAVYLDSYTTRNTFLVTQMPLPSTVIDIWRLIYDHNCTSVVMMNDVSEHDQTCSQYWPEKGIVVFGPFTVELLTQEDEVDIITRLFKVQNTNRPGEYRVVQQFQLTNWPAAQPVPFSRNSVLRIVQLVSKWQIECANNGGAGKTLVHCVAGAGRSGMFLACYNICEQMRHEYSVDVFNIVQRLRNIRPQLVETLEQYRFCYEVGIEFADQ